MLLWMHIAAVEAQQKRFWLDPERPKENALVEIIYDARDTPLEDAQMIRANYTAYQDHQWVNGQLNMSKNDTVWRANFQLLPQLALLNVRFESGGVEDNGGKNTYTYIFTEDGGLQMSGGLAGWGILRNPTSIKGTPFVVDTASYINDEVTMYWIKQELGFHPENRVKVLYPAMSLLNHRNTDEAREVMGEELEAVQQLPDLTEADLLAIRKVYAEILLDTGKAAAIADTIGHRFPNGVFLREQKRLEDYRQLISVRELDSILKHSIAFLERHPLRDSDAAFNTAHRIDYATVYRNVAVFASVGRQLDVFTKYVSQAPYEAFGQIIYRAIDVPFVSQNTVSAHEILPYARVVMDRVNYFKDYFAGDEFAQAYYYAAPLFAKILVENGLFEEAYPCASAAQSVQSYQRADLNETYVRILEAQGKTKELQLALEKSYSLNQSSTYMLALMKSLYVKDQGSEAGFETYLGNLKDEDKQKQLKVKVQNSLIDKAVSGFELMDQHGNKVRLADQTGKIVVLDFWASWCAPCKAAFPGMKLAVEHFKDDPDVVFYFVDTQEKRADAKEYVTAYIQDNNYPFTVLLDGDSKVSKSLGVGPIPHKMVVGPNGKLRFSEVGYMGSPSELADEIIEMVHVLKSGE